MAIVLDGTSLTIEKLVGIARFGEPVETSRHITREEEQAEWHYQRARKLFETGRFYESILELDQALQLNAHHKDALTLMRRARQRLEELK